MLASALGMAGAVFALGKRGSPAIAAHTSATKCQAPPCPSGEEEIRFSEVAANGRGPEKKFEIGRPSLQSVDRTVQASSSTAVIPETVV